MVSASIMFFVTFLLGLPPLIHPQQNLEVSKFYMKFTNLECDFNAEWLVNGSCKLKAINWEKTEMNISFDVKQTLRNLSGNAQLFRHETRFIPYLVNYTVNICDIFNNKITNFYSRVLSGVVKRYITLDSVTCPIRGHVQMRNAYMDIKYMKNMLALGLYKIIFTGTEGSQNIGTIQLVAVVGERFKKSNKSRILKN